MRYDQQVRIARMLDAVTLQRPEVIRIAQLGSQLFEDSPILFCAVRTDFAGEMMPKVRLDSVVIEQRVVHVEQKDYAAE